MVAVNPMAVAVVAAMTKEASREEVEAVGRSALEPTTTYICARQCR